MSRKDRSAVDTIKGYFYQFDYSILSILELGDDNDTITVEGIEDVDINSIDEKSSVQCKYYSKTEYNHSIIKKPIQFMLTHFKEHREKKLNYYIYGSYKCGQQKLPEKITVEFLKNNFLTYKKNSKTFKKHEELCLTEEDLDIFLKHLIINIDAPKIEEQNLLLLNKIKEALSCDEVDTEFYYNNALYEITKLSMNDEKENRKISKRDFLKKIDKKNQLFNQWYLSLRGKNRFIKLMKKTYFSEYNLSPFSRFFLIERTTDTSLVDVKNILIHISSKMKKISPREPKPFCPYIYIESISESELIEVKILLRNDGIVFSDGYNFKGAQFDCDAICESPNSHNKICLKIINEIEEIDVILNNLKDTRQIYQFYKTKPFYDNDEHEHIKISIDKCNDIKEII